MRTTIWDFQNKIIYRLLIWSAISVTSGVLLIFSDGIFWRDFGIQAVAWGLVDAAIAIFGYWTTRRKPPETRQARQVKIDEARKISRILWINSVLDLLYIAVGVTLVVFPGASNPSWRGHGWGIILQGGFLLLFDVFHALRVPPGIPLLPFQPFQGSQHLPFFWSGDEGGVQGRPAALLVHGFPGTPAEMRPLGQSLSDLGWTVQGLLLPGFGAQINDLETKHVEDWLQAIESALQSLCKEYSPVILIGYSMGAALAVYQAATLSNNGKRIGHRTVNQNLYKNQETSEQRLIDGLVLLAPFIWEDVWWQRLVVRGFSLILPSHIQPLKYRKLDTPQTRKFIQELLPEIDLEDPEIWEALREITIPISLFAEVGRAGVEAFHALPDIHIPTLILLGSQDEVIKTDRTRHLLEYFSINPEVHEVQSGHKLLDPKSPTWDQIQEIILDYLNNCCKDGNL